MTALEILADARARLADAPREALGEYVERRILGISRAPRIDRRGTAWHLGVLLLTDDAVLATGEVVRAREEVRRGYTAESQRRRAALAAAAARGGFADGETVHVGWRMLDPAALAEATASGSDVLALVGGSPGVRWSSSGGYVPLDRYLDERIELLQHPPQGAT